MNTQLLKLDAPYNIICGRNKIAKHVATLIVANVDKENTDRNYPAYIDMKAYSFPVVEYGDGSAAGDVWMDVEVRECRVITTAPQHDSSRTRISGYWFCEILRFMHEGDEYGSTHTPVTLCEQLKSLHVDVNTIGTMGYPQKVEVELNFEDDGDVASIYSAVGSQLYFISAYASANKQQKEEKLNEVLKWAAQYIRVLNVQTVFVTKDEQYKEMLAEWNEAIEKAAKDYNERK